MFVEHKEQGEVTEAPAKVLKLSEAIRIGARMSKPNDGATFLCGGACAVGAAYLAVYGERRPDHHRIWDVVRQHFDLSEHKWFDLGISLCYSGGQTREQIADWLESQGY